MQWWIQDFPQGGINLVGGAPNFRGGYVSKILYVETKESGPLGGPGTPPRPANVMLSLNTLVH